ncbi:MULTISPECIES: hypothetical protein [Streptomyces]
MPSRAQRPQLPETSKAQLKAKQAFNGGLVGASRPPQEMGVVQACTVQGCGSPASRRSTRASMVKVRGAADGAAAHWYCVVRCAAIARARADLRSIPMRSGGDTA